ncbi:DUF1573 domain-containing protein [Telmatocola sphagniphila]|uniref:DUF1573 domain-containing protein n=1 Tax=Telmatocola sphagniphila TaxID=1123043 RepID=A0A8E6B5B9_9BACT|nr:DUF1573 domain-containing protein [Telmatocola sphagniphila]QVL30665.1 DUF1573 domain-containing protein [Telmatocola sphagniphila]
MTEIQATTFSRLSRLVLTGIMILIAVLILLFVGVFSAESKQIDLTSINKSDYNNNEYPNFFTKELPPVIIDDDDAELISTTFTVKNDRERAITFSPVRMSCSCQDAELSKQTLQPGESTILRMGLRPATRSGAQKITCAIDEIGGDTKTFELRTTIYRKAQFSEPVIHFGMVDPLSVYEKSFAITFAATTETQLPKNIVFSSQGTVISKINEVIEPMKDGCWVKRISATSKLIAPTELGSGGSNLTATYSIGTESPQMQSIQVDWFVRSPFSVSPSRVGILPAEVKDAKQSKSDATFKFGLQQINPSK